MEVELTVTHIFFPSPDEPFIALSCIPSLKEEALKKKEYQFPLSLTLSYPCYGMIKHAGDVI